MLEARQAASRSPHTCLSQVITAIRTQFVLGQWKDRPNRDALDEGALEMFDYAQNSVPLVMKKLRLFIQDI